ncbi:MAG: hypothetical protein AAGB31_12180 [Bdellovibrio sp.]
MNLDTKIEISVGCVEWMQKEIDTLRKQNELLNIEKRVVDRFLTLTESISRPVVGYGIGDNRLWQAKKEIEEAISKKKLEESEDKTSKAMSA